jgi:hypothetical protein
MSLMLLGMVNKWSKNKLLPAYPSVFPSLEIAKCMMARKESSPLRTKLKGFHPT